MEASKMKMLWMITERGDKSHWTRIGFGTVNRDGSVNLVFDAIPTGNGKIQLRDYVPRDAESQDGPDGSGRAVARSPRAEARTESRP